MRQIALEDIQQIDRRAMEAHFVHSSRIISFCCCFLRIQSLGMQLTGLQMQLDQGLSTKAKTD